MNRMKARTSCAELLFQVSGRINGNTLASKISGQVPDKLDLLFDSKPTNDCLKNGTDCDPIFADQASVIDIGENAHQKSATLSVNGSGNGELSNVLAVHSIGHPPMARNAMAEIFDVEGTFKSGGEETPEWADKGRKNCHDENVQVVGRIWESRDVSSQLQRIKFSCGYCN